MFYRYGFARFFLCVASLFLTLRPVASAQVAVGYRGSLPTGKDADLSLEIQLGTPVQREGLLTALGVDQAYVHEAATALAQTQMRVDRVDGTDASLLFLPCSGPGSPFAHLYLLRPSQDQHWHAVDSAPLDCWWQPASYEWIQIQGKPGPVILAHHGNHGHGSGYVNDHMQLLEVRGNHLVNVLETEEFTSEDQMGSDRTIQHTSTLLPFPDGTLEETRITSERDPSNDDAKGAADAFRPMRIVLVERRRWHWVASSKSYVPDEFAVAK